MSKVKFFVCPNCNNVLSSTGDAEISCCGRKLVPLKANPEDESHSMCVEEIEDDYYVTLNHEMSKSHYISFAAFVGSDRVLLIKLYPEQAAELRFPKMFGKRLYVCCSQHGLWEKMIK